MYFVFVIKARHNSCPVTIVKSYRNKCQYYFRVTTSPFAEMQLDEMLEKKEILLIAEKKGIKKKKMGFDYCDEYEYIKQNIIMAVFRKTNLNSVEIVRLMKNQSCKKKIKEKN